MAKLRAVAWRRVGWRESAEYGAQVSLKIASIQTSSCPPCLISTATRALRVGGRGQSSRRIAACHHGALEAPIPIIIGHSPRPPSARCSQLHCHEVSSQRATIQGLTPTEMSGRSGCIMASHAATRLSPPSQRLAATVALLEGLRDVHGSLLRGPRVLTPSTSTAQLKHRATSIRTSRTSAPSLFLSSAWPHHPALVGDGMKVRATSSH
jgi:hypothetical protein